MDGSRALHTAQDTRERPSSIISSRFPSIDVRRNHASKIIRAAVNEGERQRHRWKEVYNGSFGRFIKITDRSDPEARIKQKILGRERRGKIGGGKVRNERSKWSTIPFEIDSKSKRSDVLSDVLNY